MERGEEQRIAIIPALSERCEVNLSLRDERVAPQWLHVVMKEALQ